MGNMRFMAAALLLCLPACGSAPAEDSEGTGETGATLLLTETFADGGTLQVVEQDDGFLGFTVMTPIGSEASKLSMQAAQQATLRGVYEKLMGREASAEVIEISDAILRQRSVLRESPIGNQKVAAEPQEVSKSSAWFYANLCKDFYVGSNWWQIADYCSYSSSANQKTSTATIDSDAWGYDRSYALNDHASSTATQSLSASTWTLPVDPGSWRWTEWGGSYSNAVAKIKLPTGVFGGLGITAHEHTFEPS